VIVRCNPIETIKASDTLRSSAFEAREPYSFKQSRGDESALVNYRVRLPYYIVDRLFDAAVLIVGVGRQQDRVTIRRRAGGQ